MDFDTDWHDLRRGPLRVEPMTDEELRGMGCRRVFTSFGVGADLLPRVFLPLGRMTYHRDALADVVVWEYEDRALPRGFGGYPVFGTMRVMSREDWARGCRLR